MRGVRPLVANMKKKGLRADSRRKKTVASSEQGVVYFLSLRRESLVMSVARSAS
jgi:hypothetical protein